MYAFLKMEQMRRAKTSDTHDNIPEVVHPWANTMNDDPSGRVSEVIVSRRELAALPLSIGGSTVVDEALGAVVVDGAAPYCAAATAAGAKRRDDGGCRRRGSGRGRWGEHGQVSGSGCRQCAGVGRELGRRMRHGQRRLLGGSWSCTRCAQLLRGSPSFNATRRLSIRDDDGTMECSESRFGTIPIRQAARHA